MKKKAKGKQQQRNESLYVHNSFSPPREKIITIIPNPKTQIQQIETCRTI
jgi:hypothetical protein